jgi:subtilisin family serine protease
MTIKNSGGLMFFKKCASYLLLFLFCTTAVAVAGSPANGTVKKLLIPQNSTASQNSKSLIPYAEGELLVQFVRGVDMNSVNQVASTNSMSVKKRYRVLSERTGNELVLMKSNGTTEQMILALKNHPQVTAISPNYRRNLDTVGTPTPNDPRYSELWGLNNTGQTGGTSDADIDAPEAWQTTTGSSSVIVAVIDTGVCYDHPDLAANMWQNSAEAGGTPGVDDDGNGYIDDIYGIDPPGTAGSTPDTDPMDGYGHGTHCSGTIGAVGDNSTGITGVNWTVKIMALKMFDDAGGNGYDSNAIECIEYCIDQKTNYSQNIVAINASWGGTGYNSLLKTAIENAGAAGIVFCAAAGNDGTDNDSTPHYPSTYTSSNIIAVMATNHTDGDGGMNYGATSVDVGAPGVAILSTVPATVNPSIFYDDMEGGSGNWSTGGTNNSWAISSDNEFVTAYGGTANPTNFWSDSPGSTYLVNTDSYLTVASDIDLSGYSVQRVGISFLAAWLLDAGFDNDHAYVEISNNSGSTWTQLGECVNGYGYVHFWQSMEFEVPDAYKTANFRFRFRLSSDATNSGYMNGWLIDEVAVGPYLYTNAYASWNGTSMATPHVAGAIGLIAAQYPAETVSQRIDRILNNVDPLAALSGRCTTGGRLNVGSAMNDAGTPTISVTAPTNGDVLYVTDYADITWSVSNTTLSDVVLSYSTDGGSNYTSIGTVSNTGSYTWTIPDAVTSNGKIKVASTDGTIVGESSGAFSIQYFTPTAGYSEIAYSVIPSGDGGYIFGGYCDSITTGGYDILIYKLGADGRKVWRTNLGGVRDDLGFHIERTSDGGYLVCGYSTSYTNGEEDIILYKIDANGNYLWKKNFGGTSYDFSSSVRETADGGFILLGSSSSITNGSYDFLIYKLDSSGNTVWQKNFGGTGWEYASTVIQTTDAGYVMFGESNSFTNGGEDFLLFKLDSSGNKIARKNFGGTGSEWVLSEYWLEPSGNGVVQTADGGYAFAGFSTSYTNGGFDIIVYRINHNGALLWKKNFGGAADEEAHAIKQTADGGFILAGLSNSFTNGGEDFVIYKLDSSGNEVWHKNYGGTSDDGALCIYQDANGDYMVAGYSVSFGTTPGYPDFLLFKLDSDGNKIGRRNLGR